MLRSMYITFRPADNYVGFASCLFFYLFHIFLDTHICFHTNLFFFVIFFSVLSMLYILYIYSSCWDFFFCSPFVVYCTISNCLAVTCYLQFFLTLDSFFFSIFLIFRDFQNFKKITLWLNNLKWYSSMIYFHIYSVLVETTREIFFSTYLLHINHLVISCFYWVNVNILI